MQSKWQKAACTQTGQLYPLPKGKLAQSMEPTRDVFGHAWALTGVLQGG